MCQYETTVVWKAAKECKLHAGGNPEVRVATPPDFGGPHNDWSPEQLLAGAVGASLMTSTLYYLERAAVDLHSYMSNVTVIIDKASEGLTVAEVSVVISMAVADEGDMKKTRNAVLCAEKTCPISNALQCPVRVYANVRSPDK
jgi:organic hydroperoxide reductase OsmC/OhrA